MSKNKILHTKKIMSKRQSVTLNLGAGKATKAPRLTNTSPSGAVRAPTAQQAEVANNRLSSHNKEEFIDTAKSAGMLILKSLFFLLLVGWVVAFGYALYDGLTVKKSIQTGPRVMHQVAVDRKKDLEAVDVSIARVQNKRIAKNKNVTRNVEPKVTARPDKSTAQGLDAQFSVQNKEKFDEQFLGTTSKLASRAKVRSSQLGVASVLPEFSVDKQPARQVGMSLDMVYNELRQNNMKNKKSFTESVPFGSSEYYETMRMTVH